ncbi:MAG: tRNA threonylcarbamoyladenosine dehydratase [Clostridia bacterium]|nr:tRNA threonylcarbamoyladenosine dehydratase [Clostridia bacterium]
MEQFSRTALMLGQDGIEKLKKSRVAIFGIGGVGGYVVEALARSGVGALDLIDKDVVSESNINRQIIALHSTIGRLKTTVAAERARDINPEIVIKTHDVFYLPETAHLFDFSSYDYIVDAIDTVSGKIALAEKAKEADVPIISAMGAGNKLDPTAFQVSDISKTSVCPLARVMRRELKKRGIERLKVVYSKEEPREATAKDEDTGKPIPASVAFVPSVVGLIIAGEVIKDLIKS